MTMLLIDLLQVGRSCFGFLSKLSAFRARRRSIDVEKTENGNPSFATIRETTFSRESLFLNLSVILGWLSTGSVK